MDPWNLRQGNVCLSFWLTLILAELLGAGRLQHFQESLCSDLFAISLILSSVPTEMICKACLGMSRNYIAHLVLQVRARAIQELDGTGTCQPQCWMFDSVASLISGIGATAHCSDCSASDQPPDGQRTGGLFRNIQDDMKRKCPIALFVQKDMARTLTCDNHPRSDQSTKTNYLE